MRKIQDILQKRSVRSRLPTRIRRRTTLLKAMNYNATAWVISGICVCPFGSNRGSRFVNDSCSLYVLIYRACIVQAQLRMAEKAEGARTWTQRRAGRCMPYARVKHLRLSLERCCSDHGKREIARKNKVRRIVDNRERARNIYFRFCQVKFTARRGATRREQELGTRERSDTHDTRQGLPQNIAPKIKRAPLGAAGLC